MKNYLWLVFLFLSHIGFAQENLSYQKPSAEILALADYERPPSVSISPDKNWVVFLYRPTYKSLKDLGQSETRLAGLRINAKTGMASDEVFFNKMTLQSIDGKQVFNKLPLPNNPQISNLAFSPDSKKLAFTLTDDQGTALYVMELATRKVTRLTQYNLNGILDTPFSWNRSSDRLLVNFRIEPSVKKDTPGGALPSGPIISSSDGQVSQLRTYQDLLKTPEDEAEFMELGTSELKWVDLSGNVSPYKEADMYVGANFSPDGNYVMIMTLKKPFSYVVPVSSFPMETNVYDLQGKLVKKVNETPLFEVMPKGFSSVRAGKRGFNWRPDQAATLSYVEAIDGGDASKPAEFRDELFNWVAPFDQAPKSLIKLADRFGGVIYGDENHALVSSRWYDTRNVKTFLINPSTGQQQLIEDRNSQDVYNDPGRPYMDKNAFGTYSMYIKNNKIYYLGAGYTKEGEFPFIDEMDLKTLKKKRLYTAKASDMQERISSIVDMAKGDIIVSLQSAKQFPNYYSKNIKSGKQKAITSIENPFKSLDNVHKEVLNYKRKDGVALSGTLYLPANYDKNSQEKLPLLIWAYPQEFKDKNTAGQSTANPKEFTFPNYGSFVYWVTKGYAVLDDAAFPIVGEGKQEPNDTFIPQLVANAEAAIDAVDQLGYIDRKRVAVGGHSYGAFMTAHLLSNSNLFAAGIARSGAYNRTLTPFGFQSEQRNFWDDPKLYSTMSPFMSADRMKTPMLLVHGAADNNPGTFTLQTERYFQALKNLGATVRMVILPRESHGYAAQENIFHLLWEQDRFLEKYLKNGGQDKQ